MLCSVYYSRKSYAFCYPEEIFFDIPYIRNLQQLRDNKYFGLRSAVKVQGRTFARQSSESLPRNDG